MSRPITVIVLTFNEEKNIGPCLDSIAPIGAPVFVVDSGSSDSTVALAQARGARVYSHPFDNYGAQRNWAQTNLPVETEWVLHLDADERLTPELANEIAALMKAPPEDMDGFLLRKRTFFLNRWIRHGGHYPSYHLRLFRLAKGRCEDRLYDQHYVVDGPVRQLEHDYIDVVASDLRSWSTRHVRWAEMEAREYGRIEEGTRGGHLVNADFNGNPIEQKRWLRERMYYRWPAFLRAFFYWFYRYFLRLGILDGKEGFLFHFLQGLWFRMLVDAMIAEQRGEGASKA